LIKRTTNLALQGGEEVSVSNGFSRFEKVFTGQHEGFSRRPKLEKRSLLSLLVYAHFTNDVYNFILPPLLVIMRADFGVSYFEGGVLVAVYLLTSGLTQTPIARFAEKRGLQKAAMIIGFLGMALSMVIMAFARDFVEFLLVSFLLGLSLAPYHPQGIGAISVAFDERERGSAVGVHQFGGNVGMFAAPLLVAAIFSVAKLSWVQAMLLMTIPAILAAAMLNGFLEVPHEQAWENEAEQVNGNGIDKRWLAFFSPIGLLAVAYALNAVSTRGFSSFTPSYLDSVTSSVGLSEGLTSGVIASGMVAFPLGGYLSDKLGRKRVIAASYGLAGALFMAYSFTGGVMALPLLFGAFFFGYVGSAPALAYAPELGKSGRANSSVAIVFGAGTVGNALGPFLAGPLIDYVGFMPTFRLLSLFALLAAAPVVAIGVKARRNG